MRNYASAVGDTRPIACPPCQAVGSKAHILERHNLNFLS